MQPIHSNGRENLKRLPFCLFRITFDGFRGKMLGEGHIMQRYWIEAPERSRRVVMYQDVSLLLTIKASKVGTREEKKTFLNALKISLLFGGVCWMHIQHTSMGEKSTFIFPKCTCKYIWDLEFPPPLSLVRFQIFVSTFQGSIGMCGTFLMGFPSGTLDGRA